jgi:hypothetical protein
MGRDRLAKVIERLKDSRRIHPAMLIKERFRSIAKLTSAGFGVDDEFRGEHYTVWEIFFLVIP